MSSCRGVSPSMVSLPEKLNSAGYKTHQVGKWHAGDVTLSYAPWNRGFESAAGFFSSGVDHFTKCLYNGLETMPWCRANGVLDVIV